MALRRSERGSTGLGARVDFFGGDLRMDLLMSPLAMMGCGGASGAPTGGGGGGGGGAAAAIGGEGAGGGDGGSSGAGGGGGRS